jgi:hypothetical protein
MVSIAPLMLVTVTGRAWRVPAEMMPNCSEPVESFAVGGAIPEPETGTAVTTSPLPSTISTVPLSSPRL